jgi:hypothetical protein
VACYETIGKMRLLKTSQDVVVACLSKHEFDKLLGPLEDLMVTHSLNPMRKHRLHIDDLLKDIEAGAGGRKSSILYVLYGIIILYRSRRRGEEKQYSISSIISIISICYSLLKFYL